MLKYQQLQEIFYSSFVLILVIGLSTFHFLKINPKTTKVNQKKKEKHSPSLLRIFFSLPFLFVCLSQFTLRFFFVILLFFFGFLLSSIVCSWNLEGYYPFISIKQSLLIISLLPFCLLFFRQDH